MNLKPLKDHNQRLLEFIRAHHPASAFQVFSSFEGAGESEALFRKRLAYLSSQGWLTVTGSGVRALWSVNPHQLPIDVGLRVKRPAACKPTETGQHLVPPRQYDYMHGPVYQWSTPRPARVGATDFERCASHGTRC